MNIKKYINKTANEMYTDCCTHYNGTKCYVVGYAILPCFRVALCQDCEDVQVVCNKFFTFLFKLIYPLWNGKIISICEVTFTDIKEWEYEE